MKRACQHVVGVVDAVAERALSGDVQAARLILELCGLIRRPGVAVGIQFNMAHQPRITPQEEAIFVRDLWPELDEEQKKEICSSRHHHPARGPLLRPARG